MKQRLGLLLGVLVALAFPVKAGAACGALPYTFSNNVNIVDASTTNANNNFLQACATQVDNTQIGPAGIFASQVSPSSTATGRFGAGNSIYPFIFGLASATQVPLAVEGFAGQSADLFDVWNTSARSTKYVWIDSGGVLHTNAAPAFGGVVPIAQGGTGQTSLAAAGIVTTADVGTVTNTMLAGSIAQSKLSPFAGLAVGGALTGATTGAFSTSLQTPLFFTGSSFGSNLGSAGNAYVGAVNTAASASIGWGNNAGGTGYGFITAGQGVTVNGVSDTVMLIGQRGVTNTVALDASGNLGVAGRLTATGLSAGTGTVQGSSDGSTTSYAPPAYYANGVSLASTAHIVIGSAIISDTATTVTITLTGAAIFTSGKAIATPTNGLVASHATIIPSAGWKVTDTVTNSIVITVPTAPGTGNSYVFSVICIGA